MSLTSCPPSFRIVKLGNPDAERDSINAALQAIVRCLAHSSIPDPTGHAGEYLSTDGTDIFWAAGGGGGGVTSVAISTSSSGVSVSGSPITGAGTITLGLGTMAPVNDAPSDGTTYGRLNGAWAATGGGATDGSISVIFGVEEGIAGAILSPQTKTFFVPANYNLTDWEIVVYPAATVSVDVRYDTFPNFPTGADSITGGLPITTTAALSNTGTTGSWGTTALVIGNRIQLAITANDVATSIAVILIGDKS